MKFLSVVVLFLATCGGAHEYAMRPGVLERIWPHQLDFLLNEGVVARSAAHCKCSEQPGRAVHVHLYKEVNGERWFACPLRSECMSEIPEVHPAFSEDETCSDYASCVETTLQEIEAHRDRPQQAPFCTPFLAELAMQ